MVPAMTVEIAGIIGIVVAAGLVLLWRRTRTRAAVVMQVIGALVIRKIVRIKV